MQSLNGLKKVSNYFIGGSGWQSQEEIGDIYQVHLKDQECRAETRGEKLSPPQRPFRELLSNDIFEWRTLTGSGLFFIRDKQPRNNKLKETSTYAELERLEESK